MKHLCFSSIALLFSLSLLAQQSTTGEIPPAGVDLVAHVFDNSPKDANDVTYLIPGVPAYYWRYGCAPTALGMVLGYYDTHGYSTIFIGDASTQTAAVDQAIASTEHYNDYSLPLDYYPTMSPDLSEAPAGDEHADNSIADYCLTSRSVYSNYYGWSWSNDIEPGFEDYLLNHTTYSGTCHKDVYSAFSFSDFMTEIGNNRPMMALVDTDGDGSTDHFITLVGYKQESGVDYYACHQTWDYTVHWYSWAEIASGQSWGIYCVYTFLMGTASISENEPLQLDVFPNPAVDEISTGYCNANANILDMQGNIVLQTSTDANGRIDVSSLNPGLYLVRVVANETVSVGRFVVE